MAEVSKIEWTEATWNPVTGCEKISAGCRFCYAERMAIRLKAMGNPHYSKGFNVAIHWDVIERPKQWKKSRIIFVNSMSDLFHEKVPFDFIKSIFRIMNQCPQHTFQILTKRPERALIYSSKLEWTDNIWMGVTVENSTVLHRLELLRQIPAHIRFLSLEPLLSPIRKLSLKGIDWVIAGGESGPNSRPMEKEWVREIRDRCAQRDVPFFFKQWGGKNKKRAGRLLDGRTWDGIPLLINKNEECLGGGKDIVHGVGSRSSYICKA